MNKPPEYTPAQLEEFRKTEAFIRLNQLNVGDTITEQLEKDLRLVTGPRLQMRAMKINFDKAGNAHTLDTDVIASVEQNGRDILVRPDEGKKQ